VTDLQIALDQGRGRARLSTFVRLAWGEVEPNALIWNWHMGAICESLEAISLGQIQKLLINVPPGMSKSLIVATFWPAWDWISNPARRFIFATYAQDLSDKNAILHRDLVRSKWYGERWPHVQIGEDSIKRVREFANTDRGSRFSTSVGGQVTGRHGDVLVFDDLVKSQDAEGRALVDPVAIEKANDFWFKTMATRRADPSTTRYVGIQQRLHHEDTAGKCIEQGDYHTLILPMEFDPQRRAVLSIPGRAPIEDPRTEPGELLNPDRFPRDVVEADRVTLGALTFEAQMQQNPTPREGAIFKAHQFKRYATLPKGVREIITVDCTFTDKKASDYVAIQAWGVKDPNYYLIDQLLGQWNVLRTMDMIGEMKDRRARSTGIYVEDKANGPAILQILGDTIPGLIAWSPGSASKISRAEAVAPLVEAGNVWIPEDADAPWIGAYLSELGRFPLVRHDDQVDATSMALLILHKPRHRRYKDAIRKMRGG